VSKAFVKEDGEGLDPIDELSEEAGLPAPGVPRYITRAGRAALEAELAELVATREARGREAKTDLDRKELRDRDRRSRFLAKLIERLTVVEPDPSREDRVYFGATVTVEDEDGNEATYTLVGPDESDPSSGRISVESPLAASLLGRGVGDEVVVVRPKGRVELEVTSIRYER
jgi:transcription elongation factor GreB